MTQWTRAALAAAPADKIADDLRTNPAVDDATRAAAGLLADVGLLEHTTVRKHIKVAGGRLYLSFPGLTAELGDDNSPLSGLTPADRAALEMAVAIAIDPPTATWGRTHRRAALRAVAVALGFNPDEPQALALAEALRDACHTDDHMTRDGRWGRAAYMRLDTNEPTDEDGKPVLPPTLAIPASEVLAIVDSYVPTAGDPAAPPGLFDPPLELLAARLVVLIKAAGTTGRIAYDLDRDLADAGHTVGLVHIMAALGVAAAEGHVVQPVPHGRYYATEYAPTGT